MNAARRAHIEKIGRNATKQALRDLAASKLRDAARYAEQGRDGEAKSFSQYANDVLEIAQES